MITYAHALFINQDFSIATFTFLKIKPHFLKDIGNHFQKIKLTKKLKALFYQGTRKKIKLGEKSTSHTFTQNQKKK